MNFTYPITNDGTLTNICGQRKSNHFLLRPHDLRIQLDLRTYHENRCFRGYEKWVQVFFFERSVHTIIIFYKRFIVGVNTINYQLIYQ